MRIKVIIPNYGMDTSTLRDRERMLSECARSDTVISVECINSGPVSIESAYDEVLAAPEIVEKTMQAEKEGYEAVVIYCLSDPAVTACREMVKIPVIGPGQASMLIASHLGYRFSILSALDETVSQNEEAVRHSGVDLTRLASVRSINIPVLDVRENISETVRKLIQTGRRCVDQDRAHVLVLGCLGFAGMASDVSDAVGVPVVDPAFVSINMVELLHSQKLTHSKRAYPMPPPKERMF